MRPNGRCIDRLSEIALRVGRHACLSVTKMGGFAVSGYSQNARQRTVLATTQEENGAKEEGEARMRLKEHYVGSLSEITLRVARHACLASTLVSPENPPTAISGISIRRESRHLPALDAAFALLFKLTLAEFSSVRGLGCGVSRFWEK